MKLIAIASALSLLLLSSCGGTSMNAATDAKTNTTTTTTTTTTTVDTKVTDPGTTVTTDDQTAGNGELNNNSEAKKALDINKEKWALHNIKSYQYTFSASCFCLNVVTDKKQVTVSEGLVTEAFFLKTSQYLSKNELGYIKTVDQLFGIIESAIDTNAYQLIVSYNKDYGYPETISIDSLNNLMDDEISYHLSDLM